ncbi:MAG: NAD(P)H-hydrate dehydratase [Dysgonamonadaceae bacterium]|nr:NAD(P)H-hydrate dehydratase [Dysgonamonadaceae bacterium]
MEIKKDDILKIIKPRRREAHKGDFGHALFVGGSYGKMGAAVLASRACLRTGVGLLTAHIPACGNLVLQIAVPEAMCLMDREEGFISEFPADLERYSAIGVGPGLGRLPETAVAFFNFLKRAEKPLVLDADALNILSENPEWLAFVPKNSIITPHSKEFERISGVAKNRAEQIEKAKAFSLKYGLIVVLKGAGTFIACPDGKEYVNTTGNPFMATAGSGDVLCGMILSLLAQGYSPESSAVAGVFLHGLAGDRAAEKRSPITAGDIVEAISLQ